MLKSLVDYRTDVLVRKGINHGFALSAKFHKLGLLKHPKLMGNGRKAHVKQLGNITDAHFRLKKHAKNFKPCAVAENLEKLGKVEGINLPSVGIENKDGEYNDAGTGYYVEVYDSSVIFRARDFSKGTYLPQFDLEFSF